MNSSWLIALVTLVIATTISLEKREPAKTLCWLLVLFLVPVLGIVFYLLFGENLRGKKWSRRRQTVQEFMDSDEARALFPAAEHGNAEQAGRGRHLF